MHIDFMNKLKLKMKKGSLFPINKQAELSTEILKERLEFSLSIIICI